VKGTVTVFDLADPTLLFRADVLDDPAPFYAALRSHAPVWEIPGAETFVVTSAELVNEAVARPEDFSSNLTSLLFRGDDGRPVAFDMAPHGDATHVLATADPPTHTAHRKLLQPLLAPARVDEWEADIRAMVDELLADLLDAGRGDVVAMLADPLPVRVICRVIGLPEADAAMLVPLVLDTNEILSGVADGETMQRAAVAAVETGEYLGAHLQRVLDDGSESNTLLAALAGAVRDDAMTAGEAVGMLVQLLGAGTETTTSLTGTAIRVLAEDAGLQDRLRAEPERIPVFLEEMLRLDGPFRFHYRSTTHRTELGGVEIPAGARVLLMWAAANLDDAAYADPCRLDLDRPAPKAHLAFGRGLHFCIGAPLARLEARLVVEQLLARTSRLRLDAAHPPRHRPNIFVRRLASLQVLVDARA
jgi:cytochrome P450 family 144